MKTFNYFRYFKDGYLMIYAPDWFGWRNVNSCLMSFILAKGRCNGYSREFSFELFCPFRWGMYKSVHNGHGRFVFSVGLFSFGFDFNDKKSIIVQNYD